MVSYQKFAKDVGFIGIVQILTSLGTFFLLPIITKTLGTYDYGLWAQINITVSLISPLALMGLSMGFVRFLSSETETKKIREAVYSILFFVTVSGLLASFLLYIFAEPLATFGFNDPNAAYFIQAGSFLILVNVIESITLFYFRVFSDLSCTGVHFFNFFFDYHITDRLRHSPVYLHKRVSAIFPTINSHCTYKMDYRIK